MARRKKPDTNSGRVDVLATILAQIQAASEDLQLYRPEKIDWESRARVAAEKLVPWLCSVAPDLQNHVASVLNAPALLRSMWSTLRSHVDAPAEQLEAFERQLALDDILRASVTGEVVSNVVTKYLLDSYPGSTLKSNGRSDYPDIYDSAADYSTLPTYKRVVKKSVADDYGAALKHKTAKRPVRVPDGLEVKTCRNRVVVDCHHPHAGLHLALLFTESKTAFSVTDIRVAFLRAVDYRESGRNTTATTVKYSFAGDRFVSVLSRL